nr:hypothetical protein [Tanacetum cinerariifolium]
MLNNKCRTSFAKPEFLKKAQRANPYMYDIGCYNDNLALMLAPDSDEVIRLKKKSRSKLSDLIRPFDYDKLNNLYDLFVPQREKSSKQRYFSERSRLSHTNVNNGKSKEFFNKQKTLLEKQMDESIPLDTKCQSSIEIFKVKTYVNTIINGVELSKEKIANRTYIGYIDPFIQNTTESNFSPVISRINAGLDQFHKCLNEEMVADLRYFNSLELEVDSLRSQLETQKTQFLNEIDRLSREYYYADHINAILGVYTELDETKDFCKEREQYFEIQDLKAQLQDKGIVIKELKKLIEKLKEKSVETKFEKSSVIRQPNAFKSQRPSVLGKPTTFSNSFVRKDFSKSKSVTQHNVSSDFSKPVTAQTLPPNKKSILKNTNVLAPGMYKLHIDHNQARTSQLPQDSRKTNKRVSFFTRVIPTTSVSIPQLKSNPMGDRVMRNNSQGKKQKVEDQRRNVKLPKNKTFVTACNESLNAKTLNVNSVSAMCDKCVLIDKHDMCVLNYVAKPIKRTVASESNQNPKNITKKLYERLIEIVLFIVDSGCSKHIMGNLKLLINFMEKFIGTVKFGNDQIAPILGFRDLVQGAVTIKRVYYVEGLNHNLFSVGQFCDADLEVAFRKSTCYIRDLKRNDLLIAWLWHRHLSHLNFDTINLLSKNDIVVGLPKLKFIKDHLCSSCELGKAKRKSFHTKLTSSSKRRLQLLHMDLCCSMQTLHAYFVIERILHQTSVARTPEQNGVVERRNRTLVEAARTMLSAAKVPLFFWAEVIATTCFTQNRSLVIPRHEKTPYHIINDRKPSVKFFHIFGFLCYIVRDGENFDKMKEKGDECIFVGYSTQSRAYRVFNKRTRVIMESIHVNFNELPHIVSDHVSSNPAPKCQRMALELGSLSLGPQCQDNVTQADKTITTSNGLDLLFSLMFDELLNGSFMVVSKSSDVCSADAANQRQQHTTPMNNHTTTAPTYQVPTLAPTATYPENIIQAETYAENDQVADDEFINIICTPVQDQGRRRHVMLIC